MIWLTLIFFIGINLSSIIFSRFVPSAWEAQGLWTQIMTLIMFSWSFVERRKNDVTNWPLGLFFIWAGLNTIFYCYSRNNALALTGLCTFLNLLVGIILFKCFSEYLEEDHFDFIVDHVFSWILLITGFVCVLQYFGYGQFFYIYYPNTRYFTNPVVGFIGNPTLLANFLGMIIPVLFYKPNLRKWLTLGLLCIILVIFTGGTDTAINLRDPSISGMLIAAISLLYYLLHKSLKAFLIIFGVLLLISWGTFLILSHNFLMNFVSSHGRFPLWQYYIELGKTNAVFGSGLGFVKTIFLQTKFPTADHLHLEPLQIFIELGWLGLIPFCIMVERFLRIRVQGVGLCLKSMVVGFLVSCCFNFPGHLWLMSTISIFAYSGVYALRKK